MIVVIQIGNSDDKLTQVEWGCFVAQIGEAIPARPTANIHFAGCSHGGAPWQNACWVLDIGKQDAEALKEVITSIRKEFKQDSVAWTEGGETAFI